MDYGTLTARHRAKLEGGFGIEGGAGMNELAHAWETVNDK